MNRLTKVTLVGCAALAMTGAVFAASEKTHRLEIALPEGGVAHIEYTGDVAPKVTVSRGTPVATIASPGFGWGEADVAPFATFDHVFAGFDRQMQSVMALAQPPAFGGKLDLAHLPPGTVHYSYVSTVGDGGSCSRSVQVTAAGDGKPPKVVQQVSGNCSATKDAGKPVLAATPAPAVSAERAKTI